MTLSTAEDPAAIRKMQKKVGLSSLYLLFSLVDFFCLRREKHRSLPLHDSFFWEAKFPLKPKASAWYCQPIFAPQRNTNKLIYNRCPLFQNSLLFLKCTSVSGKMIQPPAHANT